LLAATRGNARRSTGPRSAAGKQNSKLNALKHGAYVSFENQRESMQALGEDPERFEALSEELRSAFAPGDALQERQVEDLAWLYWRRERVERALSGLRRRALQEIEEWQHRRRQEMAGATFDASQPGMLDVSMSESDDPGVQLRKLLSFLAVIRAEVKQRTFHPRQKGVLETLYRDRRGWRQARLLELLRLFTESFGPPAARLDPELKEMLRNQCGPLESAGEPQHQELLRLLEEEMAYVQRELEYAEKVNEEKAAVERDAALAPVGETWNALARQEGSLDRSIDRKVRILLALRKESASLAGAPARGRGGVQRESIAAAVGGMPENGELVQAASNIKLKERTGNVAENKGPGLESGLGSGSVLQTTGGYLHPAGMPWNGEDAVGSEAPAGALPGAAI
jgi:hypothetical protein